MNASKLAQRLPASWIGVESGWQSVSEEPWDHLVSLTSSQLDVHALLIGASGSGKTTLMQQLIAQDIAANHSICVLDKRGDAVESILELCAGIVDPKRFRIIDLAEKQNPFGFNPLAGSGEPYFQALNVLDAVAKTSESWGVQLAETLRFALMLLAEVKEPITEIESLFFNATFRLQCLSKCREPSTVSFWSRFEDLSADKQSTLAMPVLNKISLLFATESLRKTLSHPNPIDLQSHLNTPGSILLISLAVAEVHSAGAMMGNMVLSSIFREVFGRTSIPESQRNPVRLYVDEFEHFVGDNFEPVFEEGRRFRLSLVLAHQTLAQLTPKLRALILTNAGVKLAFRCGREDAGILSRALNVDPEILDLANLPTGVTVLWRVGHPIVTVEVNEPMLRQVRRSSEAIRSFRRSIFEQTNHGHVLPQNNQSIVKVRPTAKDQTGFFPKTTSNSFLWEDWL